MTATKTITREDFLAMTPQTMLKDGFRDAQGGLRGEVATIWATAGATQLEPLSSAELVTTLRALAQVMPMHDQGTAYAGRYRGGREYRGKTRGKQSPPVRAPAALAGRSCASSLSPSRLSSVLPCSEDAPCPRTICRAPMTAAPPPPPLPTPMRA